MLRNLLARAQLVWQGDETAVFATRGVPEIDAGRLGYFALSVLWRTAVHHWRVGKTVVHIDLGPYEEQVRQYLLGAAPFPTDAVLWVSVSPSPEPLRVSNFPGCMKKSPYHRFSLAIPGIGFDLFVGKALEPYIRRTCSLRSDGRLMFLTEHVDSRAARDIRRALETSRPSKKLRLNLTRARFHRQPN